ncbi:hypothetical protein IMG5_202390 [Ichthyophthirius multifiliis]|uniref:DNA mismatch repair protein S5 domain-containing protein n=1 Tax=Ichthyophthirius multifiliis TaxID=5932 RepID=G0R635_ICHMU|nr:hypothetical protein IMG5_202390 [Ichthyophthirius multifiliis]EGR27058.1 hypothetical protein IMG5_202390 [Ichthyophthirius multifiliis]|eukprot:XP_004023942.1 hypothetical protein IMG5_202390 [Ichthyophthirius multifiliis]
MQIQKLSRDSIQNICVSQVIIDLSACKQKKTKNKKTKIKKGVKELLENSIDAKSTLIEIQLKDQGRDGIIVKDNGHGISKENLDKIAQKGCTSKLKVFEDLENLTSYGFRGEALNAISLLSDLNINTRTKDDPIGQKYSFNQQNIEGQIIKKNISMEIGTTIQLSNLFANIPVRRQELVKNINFQYNKIVNLVTEYALICTQIQIFLINFSEKNTRNVIINSGMPMGDILGKIKQVLGEKIGQQLVQFKLEFNNGNSVLKGFIQKNIQSGSQKANVGKNITFMYINGRPVNQLKKINYVFNEFYKKYNLNSKYIYVLELVTPVKNLDFNVSPDKREVFFQLEGELVNQLRAKMKEILEKEDLVEQKVLGSLKQKDELYYQQTEIKQQQSQDVKQKLQIKQFEAGNNQFSYNIFNYEKNKNKNIFQNSFLNIIESQKDNIEKTIIIIIIIIIIIVLKYMNIQKKIQILKKKLMTKMIIIKKILLLSLKMKNKNHQQQNNINHKNFLNYKTIMKMLMQQILILKRKNFQNYKQQVSLIKHLQQHFILKKKY